VKLIATVSFLLTLLLITQITFAQVQYYETDVTLDESGRAYVKLTITFYRPETSFEFSVLGKMEKFSINSTAGPQECAIDTSGITFLKCKLNLTEKKRTIELGFETSDFVKILEDKFYFDADLSLGKDIDSVFTSVRLPEGYRLVSEEVKNRLSYPENTTIISDGRHHIVTWRLTGLSSQQTLRFQILYERYQILQQPQTLFFIGVLVVLTVLTSVFVYIRYFRKPEKVILSVLDDFERRVLDTIVTAGGVANQKKVVQETNLSKAKVSRVVKSLAERGLIEVERLGRTNKLKIVKKKFKLF